MKQISIIKAVKIKNQRVKPFDGEKEYLATGGLVGNEIKTETVTHKTKPSRADLLVTENQLIVARMKETNKVLLVNKKTSDFIVSTGFLVLEVQEGWHPGFLFHYFVSYYFQEQKDKLSIGATQKAINNDKFKKILIPELSLEDQKRIVKFLDEADALRQKRKQAILLLDGYLKSVFLDMFGDPAKNPKKWEKVFLGDVAELITDGKHGNSVDDENSGYYFISAKDIHDGIIDYSNARQITKADFEETDRRTNLCADDLVMVNTGATIGKIAIAKADGRTRKTTFQKSVAVIKTKKEIINNDYLKYLFELRLKDLVKISTGSAQHNLLLSQMRKITIICPPLQKQKEFYNVINKQNYLKQSMLTQSSELENQFQALMQKAFKGEL